MGSIGWRYRQAMGRQRQKLKTPQILGLAGIGVALSAIIAVGVLTEDDTPASSAAKPSGPTASASPRESSQGPTPSPSETETEGDAILTAENNKDLAALLASTDPAELAKDFATKYEGRTIRYDGVIAAMNNHGNYETRFDVLVPVGDDPEQALAGPNFQFRDVNFTFDLKLTGDNVPDMLGVGDQLGVTAEVVEYDERQDLLLLDPVETTVR